MGACPKSVNLVEDRVFISGEYYLHWYEAFWEAQSKGTRALNFSPTVLVVGGGLGRLHIPTCPFLSSFFLGQDDHVQIPP